MKKLFLSFLILSISVLVYSQEALKSVEEEYYDFLSLQGLAERPSLNYRTLSDSQWNITDKEKSIIREKNETKDSVISGETEIISQEENHLKHPWQNNNLGKKFTVWELKSEKENWFTKGINKSLKLKIFGPEWFNSYNTHSPYGGNDGALWQGRGYNTSLTAGIRAEAFGFEATFKPQLSFSENREFDYIPGVSGDIHSYFYTTGSDGPHVDLVQRFGENACRSFDWGDSEIRWSFYNFTAGFGTQNPWIGPSWLNSMLGSNNAAGFPKFDIGLRKTKIVIPGINWYFGDIEARLWCGYLSESDYFDKNSSNDHNILTGLSISCSPSFIPGLTFGISRIFLAKWKKENLKFIGRLFTLNDDNDQNEGEDGKMTLSCEYRFPAIGLQIYGEFGKDDYSKFPQNPLHTGIYTVGLKQIIPIYRKTVSSEIIFEWNHFEMTQDFQTQWKYMGWFGHGKISQGYTNKGQTLAGAYGTFGNSQYLGYRVYYPKGTSQIMFHRFCPDNNYISNQAVDHKASEVTEKYHDAWETYFLFGGETSYFLTKSLIVSGAFKYMKIFNKNYQRTINDDNFYISLDLKYNF